MWSAYGTQTRSHRNPPHSCTAGPNPYVDMKPTLSQLPVIEAQQFDGPTLILLGPQYRAAAVAVVETDAERRGALLKAATR